MNFKSAIPNSLTLGNLFCGIVGIILTFQAEMMWASILMLVAGVLDFFDGFVARMLGVSGELGKQLDSLADMVTFGALPGIMMFHWISIGFNEYFVPIPQRETSHLILEFVGLMVVLFACLRLAKFNIDTRQTDVFIGVPTPAIAILVGAFPIIMEYQYELNIYAPIQSDEVLGALMRMNYWQPFDFHLVYNMFNPTWHIIASVILSFLMVMPVPLLNFKFKNFSWGDNKERFIFLGMVVLLVVGTFLPYWITIPHYPYLDFTIIPIIILLYILYSIILNFVKPKRHEISSSN